MIFVLFMNLMITFLTVLLIQNNKQYSITHNILGIQKIFISNVFTGEFTGFLVLEFIFQGALIHPLLIFLDMRRLNIEKLSI